MRSVNQRAACANHGQSPVIARRSSTLCRGTARRSANIAVSSYCYLLLLLASVTCFGLSQNVDSVFLSPSRIFLFIFFSSWTSSLFQALSECRLCVGIFLSLLYFKRCMPSFGFCSVVLCFGLKVK